MGDCINVYNIFLSQDLSPCDRLCGPSDWVYPPLTLGRHCDWLWPMGHSKGDKSRFEKCLHFGACLLTVPGTLLQRQQGWASPMSYMAPVTLVSPADPPATADSECAQLRPAKPRSMDFIKITKRSIMPKECKGCYGGLHTRPQLLPLHTSMLLRWDFARAGVCGAWAKPEAVVQPNCWHTE